MKEPVGVVGCAPLRIPALFAGLDSGAAGDLASCVASGLGSGFASCGCALGAAGRIAPALVGAVAVAVDVVEVVDLGARTFGVAATVCVDFVVGDDFFFCAAAGSGAGSEPFSPTNRDMRSNTPSEFAGSGLFDANKPPNQLPDEFESPADATRVLLPAKLAVAGSGSRGGEAWAGIVPGNETAGDRMTPDASEYGFWKAAMKVGCMPPSVRVTTGTV